MSTNIGYVYAELAREDKENISHWAIGSLKEDDLAFAYVNGETKGGMVVNDLHLTLSFGFDHEQLDIAQLRKYVERTRACPLKVAGVGMFPIEEYDCNALVLFISDDGSALKKIHDDLSLFEHVKNQRAFDYRPHLSIAYVRKDFDIQNIKYTDPNPLRIESISYKLKDSPICILSVAV